MVVIEELKQIPFEMKRLFYIYGADDISVRGHHSNKKSEFVIINVAGSAKIKLDNGKKQEIVTLDKPNMGVYIPKMMWKEMFDFSSDCVMLVISNELYDADEYIKDYQEFIEEVERDV